MMAQNMQLTELLIPNIWVI